MPEDMVPQPPLTTEQVAGYAASAAEGMISLTPPNGTTETGADLAARASSQGGLSSAVTRFGGPAEMPAGHGAPANTPELQPSDLVAATPAYPEQAVSLPAPEPGTAVNIPAPRLDSVTPPTTETAVAAPIANREYDDWLNGRVSGDVASAAVVPNQPNRPVGGVDLAAASAANQARAAADLGLTPDVYTQARAAGALRPASGNPGEISGSELTVAQQRSIVDRFGPQQ